MALLFGALRLLSVVRPQIAGKCRQHQVLVHQLSGCSTLSCARKKCQQMQVHLVRDKCDANGQEIARVRKGCRRAQKLKPLASGV